MRNDVHVWFNQTRESNSNEVLPFQTWSSLVSNNSVLNSTLDGEIQGKGHNAQREVES